MSLRSGFSFCLVKVRIHKEIWKQEPTVNNNNDKKRILQKDKKSNWNRKIEDKERNGPNGMISTTKEAKYN